MGETKSKTVQEAGGTGGVGGATGGRLLTAWSGVVPMNAKSWPSSTLYVGLSRLSSMASDCSRVNELLRWLVGWWRLLVVRQE